MHHPIIIKGNCILVCGPRFCWTCSTTLDTHLGELLLNLDATHNSTSLSFSPPPLTIQTQHINQHSLFSNGQPLLSHKPLSKEAGVRGSHTATWSTGGWVPIFGFTSLFQLCPKKEREKALFHFRYYHTKQCNCWQEGWADWERQILQTKYITLLVLKYSTSPAAFVYYKPGLTRLPSLKSYLVTGDWVWLFNRKTSECFKRG